MGDFTDRSESASIDYEIPLPPVDGLDTGPPRTGGGRIYDPAHTPVTPGKTTTDEERNPARRDNNPPPVTSDAKKYYYETDYFNGSVVSVYFGDVFVDDISFITFSATTPKIPVFPYNKDIPSALLNGNSFVQGSFGINFKESAYLYVILQRFMEQKKKIQSVAPYNAEKEKELQKAYTKYLHTIKNCNKSFDSLDPISREEYINNALTELSKFNDGKISRETIEKMKNTKGSAASFDYNKENTLESDIAMGMLMGLENDLQFESLAEAFETKIWASADDKDFGRVDKLPAFDIFIVYGDFDNQLANHTVRKIRHAKLTGVQQQVNVSGEPIQELYTFMAFDYR